MVWVSQPQGYGFIQDSLLTTIARRPSRVPIIPTWGRDDDITKFHGKDDFEVLGVCFRAEVEDFLRRI